MLGSQVRLLFSATPVASCNAHVALRVRTLRAISAWFVLGAALALGGCTYAGIGGADWPMPYDPTTALDSKGKSVAITVEDQRPYVLAGEKQPTFIGVVRPYLGIAQDTTFEPVEVVADKIRRDIAAEVSAQGYDIGPGGYTMDVAIREFRHDGYTEISIFHELEVTVSHEGQKRTTRIEDKRSGTPVSGWAALLSDYYGTMIQSIVATLDAN